MKNFQLTVDIAESSDKMTAYSDMIEESEMQINNQCKSSASVEIVPEKGFGIANIEGREVIVRLQKSCVDSIKNHQLILKNNKLIEETAKKTLKLMGFDLTKIENYIFGKTVAFALCYNADKDKALQMGFKALRRAKFAKFLSNKHLVNQFRNDPTRFDRFNEIVGHVYKCDVTLARKLAVDNWKVNLGKSIVEDSEQLKKLIEDGCYLNVVDVQYSKEQALEFVQKNLEDLNLNK